MIDVAATLTEYPLPWRFEDGYVLAANNARIWDVEDGNNDSRVAQLVVDAVNEYYCPVCTEERRKKQLSSPAGAGK